MFGRVRRLVDRARTGGNYPYVTARVRAMKTHLLPEEEYPKLIARDVHEIARSLEEGRYKEEIHDLASELSGAQLIERATQRQMADEFQRILSWCEGEPEDLLGLYFERFTVENLKTLLRGARTGASSEEVEAALVPAGLIEAQAWEAAARAATLEECLDALPRTRYTGLLEEMQEEPLPRIENALDRAYYERLVDAVEPRDRANEAFLRFLRQEVDEINLKLIFRSKHAGIEIKALVAGGREIDEELARRVQSAAWEEIGPILDETSYGDELKEALEAYQATRDLNVLTGAIEHLHLEEASEFGHLYPLSILPIVDYVLRKRLEVDRLRMIAFGKQNDLPREDIEELVNL